MPEYSNEKLDKIMIKIRGLLAKADDQAATPAESDTYRAKVEALMHQYRIEESMLIETETSALHTIVPVHRQVPVCPWDSPYAKEYRAMMAYVIQHVGARGAYGHQTDEDTGIFMVVYTLTGYDSDLRYAEFLFQSARQVFADRMEPKRDAALSDMENVYRMRKAGMERIRIAQVMGWVKGGAKVTRLYKQACAAKGEDPVLTGRDMSVAQYRASYAEGFTSEFWRRLWRARETVDSTGQDLVLHGRKDKVDEAFYTLFPHLRPDPAALTKRTKSPAIKQRKWTQADQKRLLASQSAAAQAGKSRGEDAARQVEIKHGSGGRLES